ncbi:MAG: aspartyl protease family protein [Pyrinomonadaceae bacterium]|nr:aspartyl protease family protein [Pyrinomonadaceae bacterium]
MLFPDIKREACHAAVSSLAALAVCFVIIACDAVIALHAGSVAFAADKIRDRAERALREGEFETAEKLFREKLQKDERDTRARLGLSYTLLKQRNLQGAFDEATRVATAEPTSARARSLIGQALLAVGDFRAAVEEFRIALSLRETEALAIAGIAMIDFYENRTNASLRGLRRAVSLDQKEPDFVFSLAQAAARFERYAEAADAYERFLRVAPRTDEDRRARIRGLIDFLRYLSTQGQLYRTTGTSRSVVPFELVNNRPILRVRLGNTKESLRFVLDTGSGMCVMSEQAVTRLGVRPVARGGMARAVGGAGRFEIVYGFLPFLQLGDTNGARVENVPIYVRRFYNDQEPIDGYIGLALLSKYLTSIDYAARTITLLREAERPPVDASLTTVPSVVTTAAGATTPVAPASIELPIRTTTSGFWSGEVHLPGIAKPLSFIIDTGASISVVSEDLAAREEMTRFAQSSRLRVFGAAGVAENVQMLILPRVVMAGTERVNVPAVVLDLDQINETSGFEQTGIIGGNILRHFRVTFDFQRTVVRLEPLTAPAKQTNAVKREPGESATQP